MEYVGTELHNPLLGIRIRLLEASDLGFRLEYHIEPGKQRASITPHLHRDWTETFTIVQGQAACRVGSQTRAAGPDDVVEMPAGQPHVHPWNEGPGPLRYTQETRFGRPDPDAAVDTFRAFATFYGLAREGRTTADGTPRDPLQLATSLAFLMRHGGYLAALPPRLQEVLFGALAWIARRLGYRPWYERHLPR